MTGGKRYQRMIKEKFFTKISRTKTRKIYRVWLGAKMIKEKIIFTYKTKNKFIRSIVTKKFMNGVCFFTNSKTIKITRSTYNRYLI